MERPASLSEIVVDSLDTDQSSRTPKKRAKVWQHVDTERVDGVVKAICKYCKLHLSNETGKGTSHLNRHIAQYCQDIPQEQRARFLKTMKQKPGEEDEADFNPEVFHALVAKFFISAEITFRKADDPY